jgi:hypothetical protein
VDGDLLLAIKARSVTLAELEPGDSPLLPVLPVPRGREVRAAHQGQGEVQVEQEAAVSSHLHQCQVT